MGIAAVVPHSTLIQFSLVAGMPISLKSLDKCSTQVLSWQLWHITYKHCWNDFQADFFSISHFFNT
jgi:hypothetical protein